MIHKYMDMNIFTCIHIFINLHTQIYSPGCNPLYVPTRTHKRTNSTFRVPLEPLELEISGATSTTSVGKSDVITLDVSSGSRDPARWDQQPNATQQWNWTCTKQFVKDMLEQPSGATETWTQHTHAHAHNTD